MIIIVAYVAVSLIIGIVDIKLLIRQEEELLSFPRGDIGEYVFPKPILGVHNYVFLPSWLIILGWKAIVRIINN